MSIGSRIKERRTELHITQERLADQIGVTKGAIANYENEVSTPKIGLMYKLMDVLDCDANYLHQDNMKESTFDACSTPDEFNKLIRKYRALDSRGRNLIELILDAEYQNCQK
ncbi:MAG: helix-turn-helix transcriptional regulator [Firmicutes bacterium]|nr:helix-turn-helix transcriptional regulator [Bacillota bacterium]